jgi:fluoride ion exporter CrcB/FEX
MSEERLQAGLEQSMTFSQQAVVFSLVMGSWLLMAFTMNRMKVSMLSVAVIILCIVGIVGGFALGSTWNHDDFTCKPGMHCFPWGE